MLADEWENYLGLFQASFFQIKIFKPLNPKRFPSEEDNRKERLGALIHEYSHLVQDTSTLYGLMRMFYRFTVLKGYLQKIHKSEAIERPINLDDYEGDAGKLLDVLSMTEGDGIEADRTLSQTYISIEIEKIAIKSDEVFTSIYGDEHAELSEFCIVSIVLRDSSGVTTKKDIHFGAMAVMESMSNIIEELCCPMTYNGRRCFHPIYDLVEVIIVKCVPNLSATKEYMLAICDVAMMNINPGKAFAQLIYAMSQRSFVAKTVDDIYAFSSEVLSDPGKTFSECAADLKKTICELLPTTKHHYFDVLRQRVLGFLDSMTKQRE